ncbi:MAG TPA: ABC transporter ATP-binding protein [Steroidobacteraceae bacterium]|nr:ABC transporter ATP-binding protein [Steroidobacteraceae bacterium]
MASLDIEGVSKRYGSYQALDGLSLHVDPGEVMVLLGASGCGKTSLLRMIGGFLQPDAGTIRIDGELVASDRVMVPPEKRRLSMVFQSYAVWPHKTVFENLAYGLRLKRMAAAAMRTRIAQALEMVRLGPVAERYPAELSGGQQQRVALARAMVVEPDILLLDEPLSNLDANLREEMRFEVRRLHDETNITMVYVTHDQAEAMVTADRIAVMNLGRVEQVATPYEVYERPTTQFVAAFIGRTNTLTGKVVSKGVVELNGLGVTVKAQDETGCAPGEEVAVCIRPHQVLFERPAGGANEIRGRVARSAYLGESRDYQVELAAGQSRMRVTAPPTLDVEVGRDATLFLPIEHCRVVIRS